MSSCEHRRAYARERTRKINAFVRSYKVGKRCALCPESDARKLVFHHRDPATKLFNLSTARDHSEELIIAEIAKCVLWCRSCHVKYHCKKTS